jgi:hypothetical protein
MSSRKRVTAVLAAGAAIAAIAPAAASAAPAPAFPAFPGQATDRSKFCMKGVTDFGPLGPYGPYGAYGPYGKDGPLHGQANPLGDVASCGGLLTYIVRGGTLDSFVQANLQSVGR